MINGKHLALAAIVMVCLMLSLFQMLPASSQEEAYDPWADYDSNGTLDIFDIVPVALSLGAGGDPTRNVTVVNWPTSQDVSVWYNEPLVAGGLVGPQFYEAGGFGTLHILAYGSGLSAAETATVNVIGCLYDEMKTAYYPITVYTFTLTSTIKGVDVSIPVPSQNFYFTVPYDAAVTCSISISFYLTWS
jgi:hypothetical protein